MNILDAMGLHADEIQDAFDNAADVLDKADMESHELMDEVLNFLQFSFNWNDPTNSIIKTIFMTVEFDLAEQGLEVEYYVNGGASWIRKI